jgi:hypothetical protein
MKPKMGKVEQHRSEFLHDQSGFPRPHPWDSGSWAIKPDPVFDPLSSRYPWYLYQVALI